MTERLCQRPCPTSAGSISRTRDARRLELGSALVPPPSPAPPPPPVPGGSDAVRLGPIPRPNIPDFELLERIGAGAYGEVWRARNTATGALRAVKIVYRATFADDRPFNREFEGIRKFEAISRSHPTQLALFHVGRNEAAGCFYYVMELADAVAADAYQPRTLRADLQAGRLPAARVLEVGSALTEALAHLHANGLVHRDVKPSNIVFVNGRPKLADIGLVTDATDAQSIVGTEGYLPPEGPGTPQADLFALGRVLYEALTGLDRRKYPEMPAEIRQWPDRKLAFELNAVVVRACAPAGGHRYRDAEAMRLDLERLSAGKSVKRRQRWRSTASALGKAAIALAIGGLVVWGARRSGLPAGSVSSRPPETTNAAAAKELELAGFFGNQMSAHGITNALEHFRRAMELDPNSAAAWVGWGSTLFDLPNFTGVSQDSVREDVEKAIRRALALEPENYGARLYRAICRKCYDHDWTATEAEYERILKANPKDGFILNMYAWQLAQQGRFERALALNARAREGSPASELYRIGHGAILAFAGRWPEALEAYRSVQELNPHAGAGGVAIAHYFLGHPTEAVREWLRLKRQDGKSDEEIRRLQEAFEQHGIEGYFREEIALTLPQLSQKPALEFGVASLYARLGATNEALEHLEIALRTGSLDSVYNLKVDPFFEKLHGHPRFEAALRKIGLEPR